MDEAQVFHEAVAHLGGRLDTDDTNGLSATTAARYSYAAERARRLLRSSAAALPTLPPIHFDFIDSLGLNAMAFRSEGKYFIGIYRGAVITFDVLFDRMLADPEILPWIGNPAEERPDLPLLPNLGLDPVRSFASVPVFRQPRDPTRLATAKRFVDLALDFMTAHELAHIANGHLDYVEENLGISAIDETSEPSRDPKVRERMLANQTMEMDADATSIGINLGSEWGRSWGPSRDPAPSGTGSTIAPA